MAPTSNLMNLCKGILCGVIVSDDTYHEEYFKDIIRMLEIRYPVIIFVDKTPVEFDFEVDPDLYSKSRNSYECYVLTRILRNRRLLMKKWDFADYIIFITKKKGHVYVKKGVIDSYFGFAELNGYIASIFLGTLFDDPYSALLNYKWTKSRALKLVHHEFGHLLGIAHCEKRTCIMHETASASDYDIMINYMCIKCYKTIRELWNHIYYNRGIASIKYGVRFGLNLRDEDYESRFIETPD